MTTQVFISYSHVDTDLANKITQKLEQAGYEVWLDRTDIKTGSHWDDEVVKGLNASQIFLVLLSKTSVNSQNVKDEIGYAMDHQMRVIPLLIEACEIPFRLGRIQYVDFTRQKFEAGILSIMEILHSVEPEAELHPKEKLAVKKERKAMDPALLASTVTTLIAPFLAKMGGSFLEESGKRLPDAIGKLWGSISKKFKGNPAAEGTVSDLTKNAEDKDNQDAFALQLKKAIKEDADFAAMLAVLMEDAKSDGGISNTGNGVVAADGSAGVAIGGNASGNIIIVGNNIQANTSREKKK